MSPLSLLDLNGNRIYWEHNNALRVAEIQSTNGSYDEVFVVPESDFPTKVYSAGNTYVLIGIYRADKNLKVNIYSRKAFCCLYE